MVFIIVDKAYFLSIGVRQEQTTLWFKLLNFLRIYLFTRKYNILLQLLCSHYTNLRILDEFYKQYTIENFWQNKCSTTYQQEMSTVNLGIPSKTSS